MSRGREEIASHVVSLSETIIIIIIIIIVILQNSVSDRYRWKKMIQLWKVSQLESIVNKEEELEGKLMSYLITRLSHQVRLVA